MATPKHHEEKHAKHARVENDAPHKPLRPSVSKRTAAISLILTATLILIAALSVKAGPLIDRLTEGQQELGQLSASTTAFPAIAIEGAPAIFADVDASKPYSPTPAEISSIPAGEGIVAFSLNPNTSIQPALSDAEEQGISDALSYFTDGGRTCSCLIVDLETGRGIGFNYEERVYGASAFKGIVSAYVCEEKIDNGSYELGGSLQNLMESTVEWSDNDAYRVLKTGYASNMVDWVTELGIDPTYVTRYRFPTYNAQESTALWAHIAEYLDSGSETAAWLGELFTRTNVSHIRAAVERGIEEGLLEVDGEAIVQNKAGWISGGTNSTTDAGLVRMNGHVYAISVMSNAPDCSASRDAAADVALALLVAMQ